MTMSEQAARHLSTEGGRLQPAAFSTARAERRSPKTTAAMLRMRLVGANSRAKITGLEELPSKSNYFIGKDPTKWRTNVPNYPRVKYANVYPGVDLVYYGNQRQLEYDFVVQPGADPRQIKLAIQSPATDQNKAALWIDLNGDLVVHTGDSEVRFHKPVVYQPGNNDRALSKNAVRGARSRHFIDGKYLVNGGRISFEIANYDGARPLVIDPTLAYSTYLGGSGGNGVAGIAVDASGNAYVTGVTFSSNFPATPGAFQTTGCCTFISKLNPAGSALVYSTYFGPSDRGTGIAADASGNAYVTGTTSSPDFPATPGAFQTILGAGGQDAFISKLNATVTALLYSTFLGARVNSGGTNGASIALDATGNSYITGTTGATDFPTTPGAFQTTFNGFGAVDAFVTKLNPTGTALVYSTFGRK
jgi:hypothetical protein